MEAIFRLLIHLFREFVVRIDRWFQPTLEKVIPECDELLRDPESFLKNREIAIGPLRRQIASIFLATIIGLFSCCMVSGIGLENPELIKGIPRPLRVLLVFGITGLVTASLACLFERMWRGGELVMRFNGIVLRRRGNAVFLPWTAFTGLKSSRIVDESWWIFDLPGHARDGILQSRRGILVRRGFEVRTRQFFFRKDGQAVIANYYAVKLAEVARLLKGLGESLGSKSPPMPTIASGEFLNDDLS